MIGTPYSDRTRRLTAQRISMQSYGSCIQSSAVVILLFTIADRMHMQNT